MVLLRIPFILFYYYFFYFLFFFLGGGLEGFGRGGLVVRVYTFGFYACLMLSIRLSKSSLRLLRHLQRSRVIGVKAPLRFRLQRLTERA